MAMNHSAHINARELTLVGRQLAMIGDEMNRRYSVDLGELEAIINTLPDTVRGRIRRRRNIKRLARMFLHGGGFNMGVFIIVHVFWYGYPGNR